MIVVVRSANNQLFAERKATKRTTMNIQSADFDVPHMQCPMCLSPRIADYDQDFRGCFIARCTACGVKFMNPPYSDAHLEHYYANYVNQFQANHADQQLQRRQRSKEADLRWVGEHVEPGRLLAIGCGDGTEIRVAQELGWQAEGYDVDEATTRRVAEETGATIYSGDFFWLNLPDDTYNCVFMDQVLEHPKNPRDYLLEVHRLLAPGGVLMIGCPNIMSISSMLKTALGKAGLKRKRRGRHYDTFHHLFYYSPRALARLMRQHFNYEIIAYEGAPLGGVKNRIESGGLIDRMSIALRRKLPWLEGTFRLLARKPINSAIKKSQDRKAA